MPFTLCALLCRGRRSGLLPCWTCDNGGTWRTIRHTGIRMCSSGRWVEADVKLRAWYFSSRCVTMQVVVRFTGRLGGVQLYGKAPNYCLRQSRTSGRETAKQCTDTTAECIHLSCWVNLMDLFRLHRRLSTTLRQIIATSSNSCSDNSSTRNINSRRRISSTPAAAWATPAP